MKIVLDTNVLSELMKPQGSQKVKTWVATQAKVDLFITSITQAEILYGIAILPDGKRSQSWGLGSKCTNSAVKPRKTFKIRFSGIDFY